MLREIRPRQWRGGLICVAMVAASIGVAACGSSSGSSGGSFTAAAGAPYVSQTPPKSGCGSFDMPAVKDPDDVVAGLPKSTAAAYRGFQEPVSKSPWQSWKPKSGPPYSVGVVWGQLTTDFQITATKNVVKRLKESPLVGDVSLKTTGSNFDIAQELQLFNDMINRHPDIIILEELQPAAFEAAIDRAARLNIPVIVPLDHMESKNAVGVQYNLFSTSALASSMMVRQMGGKGNIFWMHALAGVGFENQAAAGVKDVLKNCPDVKLLGEGYGAFTVAGAKTETLKLLATHPQKIDAVYSTSNMAPGIMSAFEQSGRPMPLVVDKDAMKGSLGFWLNNKDKYHGIAMGFDAANFGSISANVALRMLEGQGVKLTDILGDSPFIPEQNLGKWTTKDAGLSTPGEATGPPGNFATDEQLNAYFVNGSAPKSK